MDNNDENRDGRIEKKPGKTTHTLSKYLLVEEEIVENVFVVRPEGAIYIPEAEQFDRFIKGLLEKNIYSIVLNFEKVKQLPSLVFATIIQTYKECKKKEGDLRLCSIPPSLKRVFVTMQFDRIFQIYEQEEEAVLSYRQSN
ncbi:STAS domain-containing protein [candidate division CSSED10-310 bacterium]|uniref:Anti-sigma factor antagonist n=1 Tax=candidate division CSSED10-310 bacterium TaxID=2855610 RepID=A0ABV6YSP7_UNCC1